MIASRYAPSTQGNRPDPVSQHLLDIQSHVGWCAIPKRVPKMKKSVPVLISLAFVSTLLGAASVATPSMAASSVAGALADCTPPKRNDWDWTKFRLTTELNYFDVNYQSIDQFGNCFLVRARNEDGTTTNQFWDPQSLRRLY